MVSLGALAVLSPGLELDSCERAFAAASSTAQLRKKSCPQIFDFTKFTSILCNAQYRGQILREARARENFVASRHLRLSGKLSLHMREEADDADVLACLPQLLNRLDRLAPRVQVHDDEFCRTRHKSHQRLALRRHFHFHTELLGPFPQPPLQQPTFHPRS